MLTFFLKAPGTKKSAKRDPNVTSCITLGFNAPSETRFRAVKSEINDLAQTTKEYVVLQIQPESLGIILQQNERLKKFVQYNPGYDYPFVMIFAIPNDGIKPGLGGEEFEKVETYKSIDNPSGIAASRKYKINYCSADEFKSCISALLKVFQQQDFYNHDNSNYNPKSFIQKNLGEYFSVLHGGSSIAASQKRPHTKDQLHSLDLPNPTRAAWWMLGFTILTAIFLALGLIALGGVLLGITTPLVVAIAATIFTSLPPFGVFLGIAIAAGVGALVSASLAIYNAVDYLKKRNEHKEFLAGFEALPANDHLQQNDNITAHSCRNIPFLCCLRGNNTSESDSDIASEAAVDSSLSTAPQV
jgi:hypothetical protein